MKISDGRALLLGPTLHRMRVARSSFGPMRTSMSMLRPSTFLCGPRPLCAIMGESGVLLSPSEYGPSSSLVVGSSGVVLAVGTLEAAAAGVAGVVMADATVVATPGEGAAPAPGPFDDGVRATAGVALGPGGAGARLAGEGSENAAATALLPTALLPLLPRLVTETGGAYLGVLSADGKLANIFTALFGGEGVAPPAVSRGPAMLLLLAMIDSAGEDAGGKGGGIYIGGWETA